MNTLPYPSLTFQQPPWRWSSSVECSSCSARRSSWHQQPTAEACPFALIVVPGWGRPARAHFRAHICCMSLDPATRAQHLHFSFPANGRSIPPRPGSVSACTVFSELARLLSGKGINPFRLLPLPSSVTKLSNRFCRCAAPPLDACRNDRVGTVLASSVSCSFAVRPTAADSLQFWISPPVSQSYLRDLFRCS